MVPKREVPARVAKGAVESLHGGVFSLVAPCILSVLQLELLKMTGGESPPELTHKPKV